MYRKGKLITCVSQIREDRMYMYDGKVYDYGWIQNWSYRFLKVAIQSNRLCFANKLKLKITVKENVGILSEDLFGLPDQHVFEVDDQGEFESIQGQRFSTFTPTSIQNVNDMFSRLIRAETVFKEVT